jgi:biuret amidohydrolase
MADRRVEGTDPYPWPHDGCLDARRVGLVVAGAQGWFAARTADADEALAALARTAKVVRDAGGVVVVVRHTTARGPGPGRPGWDLAFAPEQDDLVVDAAGMSGFYGSRLDVDLRRRGVDHLAVGGLGLETAVYSTIATGNDRGYESLALADASAPHDAAVGARALNSITMSGGIFAAVGTSTAFCDALTKESP